MSHEDRAKIITGTGTFTLLDKPERIDGTHRVRNADPVIEEAKTLRDLLTECALEFWYESRRQRSESGKRMAALNQQVCLDSAEMIYTLGLEVQRLRLCIQHFDHGRMSREDLRGVVKNWNGTKSNLTES